MVKSYVFYGASPGEFWSNEDLNSKHELNTPGEFCPEAKTIWITFPHAYF